MNKVLALVVVLAIIWAAPPLRIRVVEGAVPVLEKLGPVGGALLKPARRLGARGEARNIARLIVSDRDEGRPVPDEAGFSRWLRRRLPDATGLDPWQNPYWLQRRDVSLTVGSNGPDGIRNTSDDVSHTVAF
jgi:hypothetical protein